jgi:hypothetical protein
LSTALPASADPGKRSVAVGIVRCVPAREQEQSHRRRAADDRIWRKEQSLPAVRGRSAGCFVGVSAVLADEEDVS